MLQKYHCSEEVENWKYTLVEPTYLVNELFSINELSGSEGEADDRSDYPIRRDDCCYWT